jgi:hypothetical protein
VKEEGRAILEAGFEKGRQWDCRVKLDAQTPLEQGSPHPMKCDPVQPSTSWYKLVQPSTTYERYAKWRNRPAFVPHFSLQPSAFSLLPLPFPSQKAFLPNELPIFAKKMSPSIWEPKSCNQLCHNGTIKLTTIIYDYLHPNSHQSSQKPWFDRPKTPIQLNPT